MMTKTTTTRLCWVVLALVACLIPVGRVPVAAAPLVTGDLTIYYDFDSFTNVVMDGSGNGFNGKVRDTTRDMTDEFEKGQLVTSGVISNDTSNPKRGAGAIRFTQPAVAGEDPVFLDMDGSVIKMNSPSKLPSTAATYAAWVNLEPVNNTIGSGDDWNTDGSFVQGSRLGGHGVPHFQIRGDGSFRLTIRNETGQDILTSNGAPWTAHPFPNQPEIDADPNTPPEPWPANEWFHLAATYDQNANGGAGEFAMYFNGVKIRGGAPNGVGAGTTIGAWDFQQPFNYYDGLGIGAVYDSGDRRLHGMMDEFYLFTRALSANEIATLFNIAPPGVPGDYNGDGRVDAADYVVWRKNPGAHGGDPDGYNTWQTNFGRTAAAAGQSAVPESSCFALAVIALGGMVFRRRR